MAPLTRQESKTLIDLLLRLPNINNPAARNLLLSDLPSTVQLAIAFDPAPAIHIRNIVEALNSEDAEQLDDGTIPLLVVIENAIYAVRGSRLAGELRPFQDKVKASTGPASQSSATRGALADADPPSRLTGEQYRELQAVLLAAFPQYGDLQRMVLFYLGENLAAVTASGNLQQVVFELISWAQARGRLKDLIQGAVNANSGNTQLRAFAARLGVEPSA